MENQPQSLVVNGTSYRQISDAPDIEQEIALAFFRVDTPVDLWANADTLRVDYEAVTPLSMFGKPGSAPSRRDLRETLDDDRWASAPRVDVQGATDLGLVVENQLRAMTLVDYYLAPLSEEGRARLMRLLDDDINAFFEVVQSESRAGTTPYRAVNISVNGGLWGFDVSQSWAIEAQHEASNNPDLRMHLERRVTWTTGDRTAEPTVVSTNRHVSAQSDAPVAGSARKDLEASARAMMQDASDAGNTDASCQGCTAYGVGLLALLGFAISQCG